MGGMETYAKRLTEELAAFLSLEVVALRGRDDGRPPSIQALLLFPFQVLRRWLALKQAPKILHIGDMAIWPIGMLAWLARGRTKVILSAHGTDVSFPRRGGLRGSLYGAYLRFGASVFPNARVLANSQATAAAVNEAGWKVGAVIPLGTDAAAQSVEGTHNGRILFAGRLVPLKGCSWFVENVLPLLPPEIELDVAGTVWDAKEGQILSQPRVNYLGYLKGPALAEAYRSALCVILPNVAVANGQFEGFGLVAIEAAAAGGVVLASNRDGLVDAVIDGRTGILLPPGEPESWRDQIISLQNWRREERAEFAKESQKLIGLEFNWKRVATDTMKIYNAT